ncbi:MAG: hypothetical protein WBE68_04445 [Candidatus Nitrosopolaris sp.]
MGSGFVAGMISGGVITATLGRRWVFDINVPIGVAVSLLSIKYISSATRRTSENSIYISVYTRNIVYIINSHIALLYIHLEVAVTAVATKSPSRHVLDTSLTDLIFSI